jgi:hypothetical protein
MRLRNIVRKRILTGISSKTIDLTSLLGHEQNKGYFTNSLS